MFFSDRRLDCDGHLSQSVTCGVGRFGCRNDWKIRKDFSIWIRLDQ